MPIYEARCLECGATCDYLREVSECLNTPTCIECSVQMAKEIRTPIKGFIKGNFESFKSTVDGTVITSRRILDEHNKRNNVVCVADGYTDEAVRAGAYGKVKQESISDSLKDDLMESLHKVNEGYKPNIEVQDDE